MEPAGLYPSELVPMHDKRYDALQEPRAAPVPPYTTVAISNPEPPPKDHFFWSLCCFMYANPFCLGLIAVYYSIKARDKKMLGDMRAAQKHGCVARALNISALVLVVVFVIILCFYYGRILHFVARQMQKTNHY